MEGYTRQESEPATERELAIRDVEGRTRQESEPATEQELAIRDVEGCTRQESEPGLPRVDSGIVGDTDIVTRATPFVVRFSTGEEPDNTAGSCSAGQQEAAKPSFHTAADEMCPDYGIPRLRGETKHRCRHTLRC